MNRQQAWEHRFREAGKVRFTTRLSANANAALERLSIERQCNRTDVVEGLLLGTICLPVFPDEDRDFATKHGVSPHEAAVYRSMK